MNNSISITAQYLHLMSMQDKELTRLRAENKRLTNMTSNLRNQKRIYKESATEWKSRYDSLNKEKCVNAVVQKDLIPNNVKLAISKYAEYQNL